MTSSDERTVDRTRLWQRRVRPKVLMPGPGGATVEVALAADPPVKVWTDYTSEKVREDPTGFLLAVADPNRDDGAELMESLLTAVEDGEQVVFSLARLDIAITVHNGYLSNWPAPLIKKKDDDGDAEGSDGADPLEPGSGSSTEETQTSGDTGSDKPA